MNRRQVVKASRREQRAVEAEHPGFRSIRCDDVIANDIRAGAAGKCGEVGDHIRVRDITDTDHRIQVLLRIEGEAVAVDPSIQVNGELRKAQERSRAHKRRCAVIEDESSGEFELAVQPGSEQRGPVHLDSGLEPAVQAGRRFRLEFKSGRVGVGTDDAERCGCGCALRCDPGDNRTIPYSEIFPRRQRPLLVFHELDEPGSCQPTSCLRDGVERRRGRAHEHGEVGQVGTGRSGGGRFQGRGRRGGHLLIQARGFRSSPRHRHLGIVTPASSPRQSAAPGTLGQ